MIYKSLIRTVLQQSGTKKLLLQNTRIVQRTIGADPLLFQNYHVPMDKASSIKKWFSEFKEFDWPAQGPDLNPNQHLRADLEHQL